MPPGGSLLDLGASDGGTLCHFAELRPDLRFAAADIQGSPERYPAGTDFARVDFETGTLPWKDGSFDAITCMHVVEHLADSTPLITEAARLLAPHGRLYVETPHSKTVTFPSPVGAGTENITFNFFDDSTHIGPVTADQLARLSTAAGLDVVATGISRNWLFAAAFPVLFLFRRHSRARYVAQIHWTGWSVYLIAVR